MPRASPSPAATRRTTPVDLHHAARARQLQASGDPRADAQRLMGLDQGGVAADVVQLPGHGLAGHGQPHGQVHHDAAGSCAGLRGAHRTFTTTRVTSSAAAPPPRNASTSARIRSPSSAAVPRGAPPPPARASRAAAVVLLAVAARLRHPVRVEDEDVSRGQGHDRAPRRSRSSKVPRGRPGSSIVSTRPLRRPVDERVGQAGVGQDHPALLEVEEGEGDACSRSPPPRAPQGAVDARQQVAGGAPLEGPRRGRCPRRTPRRGRRARPCPPRRPRPGRARPRPARRSRRGRRPARGRGGSGRRPPSPGPTGGSSGKRPCWTHCASSSSRLERAPPAGPASRRGARSRWPPPPGWPAG